jgi:N-methylhydantoinase A
MSGRFRLGIDVGGTFTDFVVFDSVTSKVHTLKVPTSSADPSKGILAGLAHLNLPSNEIEGITHGTTTATNALIERRGARTALVTTRGFRDTLEVRRSDREEMYDAHWTPPPPLVPRRNRFEVGERLLWDGQVDSPLDEADLKKIVSVLHVRSIEAVAVCFLHSYQHAQHEQRAKELLEAALPGVFITISSECSKEFREFERASTVAANAFVGPTVHRYMKNLSAGLLSYGLQTSVSIMQSNGGVCTVDEAARLPVRLARSGPSGGAKALERLAELTGIQKLVGLDIGGTSADVSVIVDGKSRWSSPLMVEWGLPLLFPSVDVVSIGAGGGSVAWLDSGGALHMGPESAGADPGPACYGQGGIKPTSTDAHVVLGHVADDFFAEGSMPLLRDYAAEAIRRTVGEPLGLTTEAAAEGMLQILDNLMLGAIRFVTIEKGFDPRDFALVGFGGGGPLHVVELARQLGMKQAIVPSFPGVLSAWGMLTVDRLQDRSRTILRPLAALGEHELHETLASMQEEILVGYREQGLKVDDAVFEYFLDLQYYGQVHAIAVPLDVVAGGALALSEERLSTAVERFHAEHEREYGHSDRNQEVQVVHARVFGRIPVNRITLDTHADAGPDSSGACVGSRSIVSKGKLLEFRVYDRTMLKAGNVVAGPAVIEEVTSTTIVPGDAQLVVDEFLNLIVSINDNGAV